MFKKLAVFTFENINILKEIIIFQEILSFVAKAPTFNRVLRRGNQNISWNTDSFFSFIA